MRCQELKFTGERIGAQRQVKQVDSEWLLWSDEFTAHLYLSKWVDLAILEVPGLGSPIMAQNISAACFNIHLQ